MAWYEYYEYVILILVGRGKRKVCYCYSQHFPEKKYNSKHSIIALRKLISGFWAITSPGVSEHMPPLDFGVQTIFSAKY